jgi:hypothetical protein
VRARPVLDRQTAPDDERKPISDFSTLVIAIADGHEPKRQPKEGAKIEGLFSCGSPASPETGGPGGGETGSADEAARPPRAIHVRLDVDVNLGSDGDVDRGAPTSSSARLATHEARVHAYALTSRSPSTTTTTFAPARPDAEANATTASLLPRTREGSAEDESEDLGAPPAPDPNLAMALARLIDRATVPSSEPAASNHAGSAKHDEPLPPPPRLPNVKPAIEAKSELASHRDFTSARAEQPSEPKLPIPTSAKMLDVSLPAVLVSESELAPRPSHEQPPAPRVQRPLEVSSAPAFEARTSAGDRSSEERDLDQGSPDRSADAERNLSEVVNVDTRGPAISPVRPSPQASPFAVAVNVATQLVGQGASAGSVVTFAELATEIERLGSLTPGPEGTSADFELSHPELGKVRVALSVKGAEIELRLFAPDAATAMRLSANDANLRRALAGVGLRVAALRVDVEGRPLAKEYRIRRRRGLDMEA